MILINSNEAEIPQTAIRSAVRSGQVITGETLASCSVTCMALRPQVLDQNKRSDVGQEGSGVGRHFFRDTDQFPK